MGVCARAAHALAASTASSRATAAFAIVRPCIHSARIACIACNLELGRDFIRPPIARCGRRGVVAVGPLGMVHFIASDPMLESDGAKSALLEHAQSMQDVFVPRRICPAIFSFGSG